MPPRRLPLCLFVAALGCSPSPSDGGSSSSDRAEGCVADGSDHAPMDSGAPMDSSALMDGRPSAESGDLSPDVGVAMEDAGTCAGFAYCEDFESYAGTLSRGEKVGPWVASVGGPVTATIDTVRPYAGNKSLHVVMPIGTQASAMLASPVVQAGLVAGNNLFGRAMIYYVGTPGDGGYGLPVHTHNMVFTTSGSSTEVGGGVNVNMAGAGSLNYQERKGTGFELATAGGDPSTNAWHCLQWEYDGSSQLPGVVSDHLQVWIDGQIVSDVPKSVGWKMATPWSSFSFGLVHLQTTENPVEFFMDSFALDGAPVPCP